MPETLVVTPGRLDRAALEGVAGGRAVALDPACWPRVEAAAELVSELAAGDQPLYGINTGFGKLARVRIPPEQILELQRRLVVSHMVGTGEPLSDPVVRLTLALKAASLAHGRSGARRATIEALLALLAADALPVIPSRGSVGASGDLAPLAHLSGCLLGLGEIRLEGAVMPAADALARIGLEPLSLGPKEGLALLNGTQVSTALALVALFRAERLADVALLAGAMSVDAALASDAPFDARIQAARGHPGQRRAAARLAELLQGSAIRASHLDCDRVQDPYSLRCQPQVMGACLDLLDQAEACLIREANGVSDNPLVFAEDRAILSGGNFHGEPVAFAADQIALAISEIIALSERRIALLTDPAQSELPAFLTPHPGINSGFMIAQVTAAALASEVKHLAHPASLDSLPTSANQEDHVSLSTYAGLRLAPMLDAAFRVVAIEVLAAAQGIELRRPLRSSPALEAALGEVRAISAFLEDDRPLSAEIEALARRLDDPRPIGAAP